MNHTYIRENLPLLSIILFVILFTAIQSVKPDFLYNKDGSIREFGICYRNKTILPIWGQNVGLLTRVDPKIALYRTEEKMSYPIQGSKCGYTGSPGSTGVSKHYITEFTFSNKNMALITAHLIAYPTDSSRCAQREAQASILNKVILGYIQKGYSIIMMGDFNDFDGKVLDVNSNKPTSQVLDILKGNTFGNYQLFSAAQKMAQSDRFSDWYDSDNNCNTGSSKDYSMIDHILVTEDLLDSIFDVYMYHGYPEYCGKYDSDHYPVVIEISTF